MLKLIKTRRGCEICETTPRYDVVLDGKIVGQLYFNMRGYVGTLPTPDGKGLYIGECRIGEYNREVSKLNREFKAARQAV